VNVQIVVPRDTPAAERVFALPDKFARRRGRRPRQHRI